MSTRTSTLKFNFTGDSTKIVRAFEQLSQAAKKSGGDLAAAGRLMEQSLKNAEQQANRITAKGGLLGATKTGAAGRIENVAGQLGLGNVLSEFGGAEKALEGITTKQAVAAAGAVALVAAVVKGAQESAKAYLNTVNAVDAVGDAMGSSAEEASKIIGITRGLGVSSETAANAMSRLARRVTDNEAELRKYGVIVARTADGGVDLSTTLLNVASAYQAQTDPALKAQIGNTAFGRSWVDMVDILETSRSKLQDFAALAPSISEDDIQAVKDFKAALGELRGQAEDTGVSLGRPVVGALTKGLEFASRQAEGFGQILHGDVVGGFKTAYTEGSKASTVFVDAADNMLRIALAGGVASPALKEVASASDRASAAVARFNSLFERQSLAVGAQTKFRQAVAGLAQVHQQGAAAAQKYADSSDAVAKAARDGAKAVADAQEQGAKAVADAQDAQQKSVEDGARRIVDAEERAADQIVRSQERVVDARRRAAESAQDDADRVEDARRDLIDAVAAAAGNDNPFDAKRSIEDARTALARAERDATQNAENRARDVSTAETELADAQLDAIREVSEARREAAESDAEATKRLSDAQEEAAKRVSDAQAQAAERVQGAQQSLTGAIDAGTTAVANNIGKVDDLVESTFNAAFQIREAGGSQAEINAKVREGKDALDQYGASLGLTNQQIAYYKQLLDLIPLQVRTKIVFTIESITNNARSLATNAVAAAAANAIASQLQIPQFATGGLFKTGSGGAGLAVLHDGERVLTPEQQTEGGGTTIIVQGALLDSAGLIQAVERATRRGFRT